MEKGKGEEAEGGRGVGKYILHGYIALFPGLPHILFFSWRYRQCKWSRPRNEAMVCRSIYLSIYLSIYQSIYLSIYLSIYPSIYLLHLLEEDSEVHIRQQYTACTHQCCVWRCTPEPTRQTPSLPGQTPPDRSPGHREHHSPPHSVSEVVRGSVMNVMSVMSVRVYIC